MRVVVHRLIFYNMEDIELRDVKIAKDFYVPKDKVKYYAAYSGEFIINDVRKMRKTEPGKVTNATFGKKIMSVIYLTTGDLIIVNTSIDTLVSRFAEEE